MSFALTTRSLRAALIASTCLAMPVMAQFVGTGTIRQNIDGNGVDLTTGTYNLAVALGSIGAGDGAMSLVSYFGGSYGDNQQIQFTRSESGTQVTISLTFGGRRETFTAAKTATSFNSDQGTGATLTKNSKESYTLLQSDGTSINFGWPSSLSFGGGVAGFCSNGNEANCALLASTATFKSGKVITYTWRAVANCTTRYVGGEPVDDCAHSFRLESVANNFGYQTNFQYQNNVDPTSGLAPASWRTRVGATLVNTLVSSTPLSVSYAYPSSTVTQLTDTAGRTTTVTRDSSGYVIGVQLPGSTSNDIAISYTGGIVSQVVAGGVTTTYARSVSGTTATMTATTAAGTRQVISDLTVGRPTSDRDELLRSTSFTYDTAGRTKRITAPEGNYVEYVYDTRGNITSKTEVAKTGSGLASIATYASFPATCTNPASCNKPDTTTDANSAVTNYTYDPVHGGVTVVTAPAPTAGAARPETRYTYTLTGGIYLLTSTSSCQTASGAACVGTADEVKTTITYGLNGLPSSISTGAGNGSLTATQALTYDAYGNVLTVDGPLPGTGDTLRYRYDLARQQVGVVSPDPDGGGALKNRARRTTYNSKGQVTKVETGTTNSQSDADWTAMVVLASNELTYDANNRRVKSATLVGTTTTAIVQYSYDSIGRLSCTAQRMNPAVFGSLPSSACTLGTAGTFGPDRITQNGYDAASQLTTVTTALGTAQARIDQTFTYTSNGKAETLTDGNGNKTTNVYDGFDRVSKMLYPSPTTPGTSNTADYEQLTYDAGSNVTASRKRSGEVINFSYDALGRVTVKDLPGGTANDVYYAYDNLGRQLSARFVSASGTGIINSYDALGRLTATSNYGTARWAAPLAYQYDLAGQRTRMTWWDGNYVSYDYDLVGEMTAIRQNGATSGTGVLATFSYDDFGRRTALNRGNGTSTTYSYDSASRLASLSHDLAGTAQDVTFTYAGYNPAGQLGSRTRSNDAYAFTLAYNVDRTYSANGLNQLTTSGAASLTYDTKGNLVSDGSITFAYDTENRLRSIPSGGYGTLEYDPYGRLLSVTGGITGDKSYSYDGDHLAGEFAVANSGPLARYVFGPNGDEPLVWYQGGDLSTPHWLYADEKGSAIAQTDASGAIIAINSYNEFGINGAAHYGAFGYTGQHWIPEAGLYNYKARMYSPTLGRFMQTDPIGYDDGINIYNYTHSDPVNGSDPDGTQNVWNQVKKKDPNRDPGTDTRGNPVENIIVRALSIFKITASELPGNWPSVGQTLTLITNWKNGRADGGAPQNNNTQCVNADGTVSGDNTGSNTPGFGDVWAVGGGVVAAAGPGGGVETGVWYDRSTGAHGGFVTTYYMAGTPGGGVAGNVTNFSDLASFTGWSTGVSGAGELVGAGGAQSSSGGWGHSVGAGFRTPQLSAYRSYTKITSGLPRCK